MRHRAMSRRAATWVVAAALGLGIGSARAGPCTSEIAKFEQAVRQSAGNPNAGPMAPQSIGAQLDRQPTPALDQTRRGAGESGIRSDLGTR